MSKGFQSQWKAKRCSKSIKSQNSKPIEGLPIKASQKAKGFSKSIQGQNPKSCASNSESAMNKWIIKVIVG